VTVAVETTEEEVRFVPDWARSAMAQPTYSEARTWFEWLQVFTTGDVADSMGIDEVVAQRYVRAGVWHGIIYLAAEEEGIYEYVPLPPGPTHHFTQLPEWQLRSIGCGELAPVRGLPIRLQKDDRKEMSTPGSRGRAKRREARYKQMQEAVAARRQRQLETLDLEPRWRRVKKKSKVVNC
jgi:hypothetical protein